MYRRERYNDDRKKGGSEHKSLPKVLGQFIERGECEQPKELSSYAREIVGNAKMSQIRGFYNQVLDLEKKVDMLSDTDYTKELLKLKAIAEYKKGRNVAKQFYRNVSQLVDVLLKEKREAFHNFFLFMQLVVAYSKQG